MIISNYAIRNRVAVFVLMVLISVVGIYSYNQLPREAFPD
ncbi:MAG: efflux RND transporter permease subunit, partial [Planctomycetaceae bacterium]